MVDSTTLAVLLRVAGLLFFGYVAWAAVFGPDLLTNPTLGVVYVLPWVGLVPLSLLFGPFYRAVSPVRTIQLRRRLALGTAPVSAHPGAPPPPVRRRPDARDRRAEPWQGSARD